jgi:hypothetical protein
MKTLFVFVFCLFFSLFDANAARQEKFENLKRVDFPSSSTTLNMAGRSRFSYEDAMNRFERTKPNGFVIESIRYARDGADYIVLVRLRRVN